MIPSLGFLVEKREAGRVAGSVMAHSVGAGRPLAEAAARPDSTL
ncbi:MAG: hypothetical protein R3A44_30895 [Caldilineaceae bacterium]